MWINAPNAPVEVAVVNLLVRVLYIIIKVAAASVAGSPIVSLMIKLPVTNGTKSDFSIAIKMVDFQSNK